MNKCDGIKILELDPKRILDGVGVRLKIELNRFYTGEAITLYLEQSV